MPEELTKPKSFEEKITERLKETMSDLVTPEDLKKFVERGIEKALFEKRYKPNTDSWRSPSETPSIVEECVSKFIEEKVRTAVEQWLKENPEKIQKALDDAIQLGVAGCVMRTLDNRFQDIFGYGVGALQNLGLIPFNPPQP